MFKAIMVGTQLIFGEAEQVEVAEGRKTVFTNPMTIVVQQVHPAQPPQAALVPVLPGDPSRVTNRVTYKNEAFAEVDGDIVTDLEKKYIEATSRIQLAGQPKFN